MINKTANFLRTPIVKTKNVYIDLWSIVHFISGYLLYSYLNLGPIVAISFIVLFEAIEPKIPLFRKEHKADTVWDLIITTAGYFVARGGI